MNEIIRGEVVKSEDGWYATVTKTFAPEYGGGQQVFNTGRTHPTIHHAIDDLRLLATATPARRTDLGEVA